MIPPGDLVLLDTGVLVHLIRGKATGQHIASTHKLLERAERPLLSIISVGEILSFAARNQWGVGKIEKLHALLAELVIVKIENHSLAEHYSMIDAFCEANGRSLGDNDRWIAATAAYTGAVLLTLDKDFDPLDPTFLRRIWIDPAAKP